MNDLTYSQREVLRTLVTLYNKHQRLIKSTEIAQVMGKDDGTIRNMILDLKTMGFVESKTGPNGGYKPTSKAYNYLRAISDNSLKYARIRKDGRELDVYVLNVEFLDLSNPYANKAVLKVTGDINSLKLGDRVRVGPLPFSRLFICGYVLLVDTFRSEVVVEVENIVSIPRENAGKILSNRKLVTIGVRASVMEAAKKLNIEGIRGIPVVNDNGELVGIITSTDVIKALVNNELDAPVVKYMRTNVVTASPDEDISEIISKMIKNNVGRVVVVYGSKPIGIITRTDILQRIAGLES